jgi:hypothetical protein
VDRFEVGPWRVEADPGATREAYASGPPIRCDCASCTNFRAVRADVYPAEFLQLLDLLGVDSQAEDEVAEYGPARAEWTERGSVPSWWDDYLHERGRWQEWTWLYMGWFWALGRISGPPTGGDILGLGDTYEVVATPSFSYELASYALSSLREGPRPVKGSPFDTGDSFRIEFMADAVPWVLETPPWEPPRQGVA